MDLLAFIAALASAVAWPGVTLAAIVLLRREIRALVPLITSLKYKGLEVTFGRDVAEVRAEAAELPAPPGQMRLIGPQISDTVERLLATSSRAAIIEAWREVEEEARSAAVRKEVAIPQLFSVSPLRILHALAAYHVVSSEQLALLHDLRALRNQAAHAPEFALSETSARDFAIAAARLVQLLKAA